MTVPLLSRPGTTTVPVGVLEPMGVAAIEVSAEVRVSASKLGEVRMRGREVDADGGGEGSDGDTSIGSSCTNVRCLLQRRKNKERTYTLSMDVNASRGTLEPKEILNLDLSF
jgi:hypothetical protein